MLKIMLLSSDKEEVLSAKKAFLSKNVQKIFNALLRIAKTTAVKSWVERNLKNWVLKTFSGVPVSTVEKGVPDWVEDDLKNNKKVFRIDSVNEKDVSSWREWVRFLNKIDLDSLSDFSPSNMEDIIKNSEGTKFVRFYKDTGFYWVRLLSPEACDLEGKRMNNCVGTLHQGAVKSRKEFIFSLRDRVGTPHVDVGVLRKKGEINEIKGNSNKPVKEEYMRYLLDFLNNKIVPFDSVAPSELSFNRLLFLNNTYVSFTSESALLKEVFKDYYITTINDEFILIHYKNNFYVLEPNRLDRRVHANFDNDSDRYAFLNRYSSLSIYPSNKSYYISTAFSVFKENINLFCEILNKFGVKSLNQDSYFAFGIMRSNDKFVPISDEYYLQLLRDKIKPLIILECKNDRLWIKLNEGSLDEKDVLIDFSNQKSIEKLITDIRFFNDNIYYAIDKNKEMEVVKPYSPQTMNAIFKPFEDSSVMKECFIEYLNSREKNFKDNIQEFSFIKHGILKNKSGKFVPINSLSKSQKGIFNEEVLNFYRKSLPSITKYFIDKNNKLFVWYPKTFSGAKGWALISYDVENPICLLQAVERPNSNPPHMNILKGSVNTIIEYALQFLNEYVSNGNHITIYDITDGVKLPLDLQFIFVRDTWKLVKGRS